MPQPCPDGIDVYARPQQMGGGGMANGVRAYALFGNRWDRLNQSGRMALNQRVNAKPGQRLATTVEKDMLRWLASIHHLSQHGCCPRPERATALFVALAVNEGGRTLIARRPTEAKIANLDMCNLVRTRSSVIQ